MYCYYRNPQICTKWERLANGISILHPSSPHECKVAGEPAGYPYKSNSGKSIYLDWTSVSSWYKWASIFTEMCEAPCICCLKIMAINLSIPDSRVKGHGVLLPWERHFLYIGSMPILCSKGCYKFSYRAHKRLGENTCHIHFIGLRSTVYRGLQMNKTDSQV